MGKTKGLEDGIGLLQQGDLDGAMSVFQDLLARDPGDAAARLWLGNAHVLEGDLKEAKAAFIATAASNNEPLQIEAKRQLRILWFNRVMQFLLISPPLRWLLLLSVIGYAGSWGLRAAGQKELAAWVGVISVWGLLSLFFTWVLFILSYFIGNIAFGAGAGHHKGARSARIAIALSVIFVIPANLLMSYGFAVKALAIFLNAFVACLLLSRGLNKLGRRLAGESGSLLLNLGPGDLPPLEEYPAEIPKKSTKEKVN